MRLSKVERGHGLVGRIKLGAVGLAVGERAPDVLRVFLYRKELFGAPFMTWMQELMRGASEWTVGERELMAAIVSHTNRCQFCISAHTQVAGRVLGEDVVRASLEDWRTAPVREPLRLVLGFLVKLTERPDSVERSDVQKLRDAGISDDGIHVAVSICTNFCILNRVADALGFEIPSASALTRMGAVLLRAGYQI